MAFVLSLPNTSLGRPDFQTPVWRHSTPEATNPSKDRSRQTGVSGVPKPEFGNEWRLGTSGNRSLRSGVPKRAFGNDWLREAQHAMPFISFRPSPVTPCYTFQTPLRSNAANLKIQSRLNDIAAGGGFVALQTPTHLPERISSAGGSSIQHGFIPQVLWESELLATILPWPLGPATDSLHARDRQSVNSWPGNHRQESKRRAIHCLFRVFAVRTGVIPYVSLHSASRL